MTLPSVILLSTAEVGFGHPLDHTNLQSRAMRNFAGDLPDKNGSRAHQYLFAVLEYGAQTINNVCLWSGVHCDAGFVQAVRVHVKMHEKACFIDMAWLPASVEYASIQNAASNNGWTVQALPRQLKYLFLENVHVWRCSTYYSGPEPVISTNSIRMSHLPENMEEFIVCSGWWRGDICLFNVPRNLRIVCVINQQIAVAHVAFEELPMGFEYGCFAQHDGWVPKKQRIKIVGLGEAKTDRHVRNLFNSEMLNSRYTGELEAKFAEQEPLP